VAASKHFALHYMVASWVLMGGVLVLIVIETGKLSNAVMAAGPSCANVSSMFVRAPENELNFGADTTFAIQEMEDRCSEAYRRVFNVPLRTLGLYRSQLLKNFHPFSYAQLAAEYRCIVVRTSLELNAKTSFGLLELNPNIAWSKAFTSIRLVSPARKSGALRIDTAAKTRGQTTGPPSSILSDSMV
jgi:hypothetical protein